jgi:hypothetical protein
MSKLSLLLFVLLVLISFVYCNYNQQEITKTLEEFVKTESASPSSTEEPEILDANQNSMIETLGYSDVESEQNN